jgi:hypothetical protein
VLLGLPCRKQIRRGGWIIRIAETRPRALPTFCMYDSDPKRCQRPSERPAPGSAASGTESEFPGQEREPAAPGR